MKISPQMQEMIKHFESDGGPCLTPNQICGDVPTVGWGHTKDVKWTDHITVEDAERFFQEDLNHAEGSIGWIIKVPLSQNQFDSLVSFVFNLGHLGQTMQLKLNKGDYIGAADEFDRWVYFRGKRMNGLIKRRKFEKEWFLKDAQTPA